MNPSLLIISGIIFFIFVVSLAIRYLFRRRVPSSAVVAPAAPPPPLTEDQRILIDSLPLFTYKTSSHIISDLSHDCSVCLSSFKPEDQLRLLPYCCHAFHSACIDKWLSTSLSCPLCRTSVLHEPDLEEKEEEDLEAQEKKNLGEDGEEVVERERGERGIGVRGYVGRMVSSASSSFSFARSGRRHENEVGSWDLNWADSRQGEEETAVAALYSSFYRWVVGA